MEMEEEKKRGERGGGRGYERRLVGQRWRQKRKGFWGGGGGVKRDRSTGFFTQENGQKRGTNKKTQKGDSKQINIFLIFGKVFKFLIFLEFLYF